MQSGRDDEPYAEHAADRLLAAIAEVGAPVCVGIDPVLERLPVSLCPSRRNPAGAVDAIASFTLGVLDAVAEQVPCVKLQSACFERYRHLGIEALDRLTAEARTRGLQVILDAKRGDISVSAEHYAAAAFDPRADGGDARPDWVTVNAYFGADGIRPFLRRGFGAFALVRTSNPASEQVQGQRLTDGRTVAESIAGLVAATGEAVLGRSGFSALGAVVAATTPADAGALRRLMPQQIFLVPGFGAQGGRVEDIRPCFGPEGKGAIVTASRSVIYAFDPQRDRWADAVSDAAKAFADQIAEAVGLR
ncbi:MAG: orotidine-5'-phosphate decarboxylase [Planctomycetota bacterium]|jgi:orotidine-5'-phosphate decarboxylase